MHSRILLVPPSALLVAACAAPVDPSDPNLVVGVDDGAACDSPAPGEDGAMCSEDVGEAQQASCASLCIAATSIGCGGVLFGCLLADTLSIGGLTIPCAFGIAACAASGDGANTGCARLCGEDY